MGSIMMHLCISKKIQSKYNFSNDFLIGAVLPDIYKRVSSNRNETHYIKNVIENGISIDLPDLDRYVLENGLDNDINRGYFAHLVQDYIWFKYFSTQFARHVGFDSEGVELFTFKNDNYQVIHKFDEYKEKIYNDYASLDHSLFSETNIHLDDFKNDVKSYLNDPIYYDAIDSDLVVHTPISPDRVNYFITDDALKRYIHTALEAFDMEYKKYTEH